MAFNEWYAKYFGYSFFGTKAEHTAHMQQFLDCWKASQTAVNTSSRKFHQWYQLNKHKFNYDYQKAKEIYEQENK